jgi:hypothetical protein
MRAECGNASLVVGFFLPWADVCAALAYEREEKSHLEERFDEKTGRKKKPVKVVDEEGGRYIRVSPEGQEWLCPEDTKPYELDDEEAFFEELGARVGCGVFHFGGGDVAYIAFDLLGDSCSVPNTSYDVCDDWDAGSALSLSKVVETTSSFKGREVRERLEGMGLKVGEVLIFPALHVTY